MSINKGSADKGNENIQRKILPRQNTTQKPANFNNISKPSPLVYDSKEFPSLNESTGKASSSSCFYGKASKYSDKLKLHPSTQNQNSVSENLSLKCDPVVTNMYAKLDDTTFSTKLQKCINKNKAFNNSVQGFPRKPPDKSYKGNTSVNEAQILSSGKNELPKWKQVVNTSTSVKSISDKLSTIISNNANLFPKSKNQIQSNQSVKLAKQNNLSKEEDDDVQGSAKAKKKKKRKSKLKRQVALQSGKITVLTPEVHLKILNQTSALTTQNCASVLTDINDEEEYPELGKPVLSTSQKENILKRNISSESKKESIDKSTDSCVEMKSVVPEDDCEEFPESAISDDKTLTEKKGKSDKEKIHVHDPITISFHDILANKNPKPKVKELKDEGGVPSSIGLTKIKTKMNLCHPHNLLDSSSPAIKRGKEREKPKPKKPSHLKKIILLDRKARKEHLLQMRSNTEEETITYDKLEQKMKANEDNEMKADDTNLLHENNFGNDSSGMIQLSEDDDQAVSLLVENNDQSFQDEVVIEMERLNVSELEENYIVNDLSSTPNEDIKTKGAAESSVTLSSDKLCNNQKDSHNVPQRVTETTASTETSVNVPRSPESLLNSLTGNIKSEISDKEKAAKILLHTRHFRPYCDHLISKDIDDVVFALLDDLARFQDRLHQKDPVKARMKRRLIYGVKEVKKYIKLRKLKCIIIAVDIENVETQGGLNDFLNDIKMSATDHHIPCIFALGRKALGKVCHKPVPVSCVGVFNYEGSETNFKKMLELQTQSKTDYADVFNKLLLKLTDEESANLIRAQKEAPETLRAIRTDILSNFFLQSKNENIDLQTKEQLSHLI